MGTKCVSVESILIAQCCGGSEWKDLSREASQKGVVNLLDSVLFHGSICLYLLNHCLDYCGFITSLVIYLFLKLFILYWGEAY